MLTDTGMHVGPQVDALILSGGERITESSTIELNPVLRCGRPADPGARLLPDRDSLHYLMIHQQRHLLDVMAAG